MGLVASSLLIVVLGVGAGEPATAPEDSAPVAAPDDPTDGLPTALPDPRPVRDPIFVQPTETEDRPGAFQAVMGTLVLPYLATGLSLAFSTKAPALTLAGLAVCPSLGSLANGQWGTAATFTLLRTLGMGLVALGAYNDDGETFLVGLGVTATFIVSEPIYAYQEMRGHAHDSPVTLAPLVMAPGAQGAGSPAWTGLSMAGKF